MGTVAEQHQDPFSALLGAGRGQPPADRLDAASPSPRARAHARSLLTELTGGQPAAALAQLADHSDCAERPLLRALRRAVAGWMVDSQMLSGKRSRAETALLFGLAVGNRTAVLTDLERTLHLWPADAQRSLLGVHRRPQWAYDHNDLGLDTVVVADQHARCGLSLFSAETRPIPAEAWKLPALYDVTRCRECARRSPNAAPFTRAPAAFDRDVRRVCVPLAGDALDRLLGDRGPQVTVLDIAEASADIYRYAMTARLVAGEQRMTESRIRFLLGPYHYAQILHASGRDQLHTLLSETELRRMLENRVPTGSGRELAVELTELRGALVGHVGDWAGLRWESGPTAWVKRS